MRSGYLSVSKNNSALSFVFYGKEGASQNDLQYIPTIIWLNGGPGESSQMGNLNGVGPLTVQRKLLGPGLDVKPNKFAWTKNYNMLFVDNPIGTGLSYADPSYKDAIPSTS